MSINLVSLVSQYLTPELIGRIAATLGVDRSLLGRAAIALAPVLLRTLAGLATTPAGVQRLAGAIEKQDPGILDNLASAVGGSAGLESLAAGGTGALDSLLGGSAVSAISGAISKFTGLGEEAASSVIGVLTPAVLGTLKQEQTAQGLDASGLAKLLASQKENISKALPPELGDLLGQAGLPGFAASAQAAQKPAVTRPAPAAIKPAPIEEAPQSFNWRLVLGAVLAIAAVSWLYFGNQPAQVVEQTKTAAGQAIQNLSVDGVDLTSSVQNAFSGLKTGLQGITDKASAQAAIPQLEKESIEFDKLRELASKLPVDGKTAFATLVTTLRPTIENLFNKVLEIPGVAPIAKPVIDGLRVKLDSLSKAESKA